MSYNNIEILNGWIWNKGWEVPGESLLSGLLKLSWTNSANAQEILKRIFDSSLSKSQNLEVHPRSFLDTNWTEQCISKNVPYWIYKLVLASSNYSSQTLRCLYTDKAIRYCKECLAHGVHFSEFQMETLLNCPHHKLPLIQICESCNRPTSRYALCDETFRSPFNCHHCGLAYSSEISALNFEISDAKKISICESNEPIADWVSRIASENFQWLEKEACLLTELEIDPSYSRRMMFAQAVQSVLPLTNVVSKNLINFQNWQSWTVAVPPKLKNHWFYFADAEMINERRKIYKSIRRHLNKKHIRLHKLCLESACIGGLFGHLNSMRLPNAHCCIWAQTWMFWRSRFEDMYLATDLWKGHRWFDDRSWKYVGGIDDRTISNQEWSVKVLLMFHGVFRLIRTWVTSRWQQALLSANASDILEFETVPPPYLQLMIASEKNIEVFFAHIIYSINPMISLNYRLLVGADESNQFKAFHCVCNPFFPKNS